MDVNAFLAVTGRRIGLRPARPHPSSRFVKIGFLGGSFDPVHFGHLCAALDACEQGQLERVVFVPTAHIPHKRQAMQSSGADRLALLRLAIEENSRFEISDYELRHGGVSYTIDSVRHFRRQYPHDRLFWIVGGDQLAKLHLWRDIRELAQSIEFIFIARPGHPVETRGDIPGLRLHRCDGHNLDISSTELRARVKRGLSLDCFAPTAVVAAIVKKGLYRS